MSAESKTIVETEDKRRIRLAEEKIRQKEGVRIAAILAHANGRELNLKPFMGPGDDAPQELGI